MKLLTLGIALCLASAAMIFSNGQSNAARMASGDLPGNTYLELDQPVELGAVTWNRDLDSAQKLSRETGKPIFILFQEVPG